MTDSLILRHGLQIDPALCSFIEEDLLPDSGATPDRFWRGLAELSQRLGERNQEHLARRAALEAALHERQKRAGPAPAAPEAEREFLESIGYMLPEGPDFLIEPGALDAEFAAAGPQLVTPLSNARFALNAANARWGSLYDALYATDAIPFPDEAPPAGAYDAQRGAHVVAFVAEFLDSALPLVNARHAEVSAYRVIEGAGRRALEVRLQNGGASALLNPEQFVGYARDERSPDDSASALRLLCRHHGLHIELQLDPAHPIGRTHPAGLADVVLEAALTTIQDCEDSVATVDAADKIAVYRNWLGLMRGDLAASFEKNGRPHKRRLNPDRTYTTPAGETLRLPGRSLMLVRHVGAHLSTDAVLDAAGAPIQETFLDAMTTAAAALHDLRRTDSDRNSRVGAIYVVKPKVHGPEEAALVDELFTVVEDALGLAQYTIKVGLMDEERRTSVNLKECLRDLQRRLVFINTGFLDRTGDEIHTNFYAGPVPPKAEFKNAAWLEAYETNNVAVGLACGLGGRAQIGKGMWAQPDAMAAMLQAKRAHPESGANCAWTPSPSAATLHALHYHAVDVRARQTELARVGRRPELRTQLLTPIRLERKLSAEEIDRELANNLQGILGYVVRWIDQGVGCSRVPDLNDVDLMEDRATLRIASQHVANWLQHGVISETQLDAALARMAAVVDRQNAMDPAYRPLLVGAQASPALRAARELVLSGAGEINGYTERVLFAARRSIKTDA